MGNNSVASQGKGNKWTSGVVNCTSRDTSQELQCSVSCNPRVTGTNNNHRWNKYHGSSKMIADKSEVSAKLHKQRFGDLAQWLQNDEDDSAGNYIDRRVVEDVMKCWQLGKQCKEMNSNAQRTSHAVNYLTNVGRLNGESNGSHTVGDLCHELDGKLDTEVDGDSGFSGDRNSSSSTSSNLSVESSLLSLGLLTDFWFGNKSNSGVLSADQCNIQPDSSISHIPGSVPPRTTSLSSLSSSNTSQIIPDVQSSRLVSEQFCESTLRRKTLDVSSQSCHASDISVSDSHIQQPLPLASNSG